MRRGRGRSTGRRTRGSKAPRAKVARGAARASKGRAGSPAQRARKRSRVNRAVRHGESARRERASGMQGQRLHGRAGLQASRRRSSGRRLPEGVVPAFLSDARKKDSAVSRRTCAGKKQVRRAVIIATGYGGVNGAREYARRKSCR